ncbi:TrmH family RNA methyltransferase [Eubacteriales bacterium OttesenSCG-928-A19]|nr:TrmH family RNA methyltransferase [Eubacteriales bacterium OttesenSCG-928-A19]
MPKLAAYRRELAYSYAPGVFPSHALLDARPDVARRLLVHSAAEASEGVSALIHKAEAHGVRVEVADHALARISHKENCYAAVVFDKYEDTLDAGQPHIVLHQPSDMGNLGSILRTCLGFGLPDLAIITPAADPFDPRVVRASMGALFGMRVRAYRDFSSYHVEFARHTRYPFMLDGSVSLAKAAAERPAEPYALIFGNEAAGLPAAFADCGTPVRIPHSGRIDSLNLAVAVSIAAYEFTRGESGPVE